MTTKQEIRKWFELGIVKGSTHLIVACDTFNWNDYPVFVSSMEDVHKRQREIENQEMTKIMEVYNLSKDVDEQLSKRRCFEY